MGLNGGIANAWQVRLPNLAARPVKQSDISE